MFFHVLSCSFMFFHVSFSFVQFRSFSFMFFHFHSFSFIFIHFLCLLLGAQNLVCFGASISLRFLLTVLMKKINQLLGPSRGRGTPFGPSFPVFSSFFFSRFLFFFCFPSSVPLITITVVTSWLSVGHRLIISDDQVQSCIWWAVVWVKSYLRTRIARLVPLDETADAPQSSLFLSSLNHSFSLSLSRFSNSRLGSDGATPSASAVVKDFQCAMRNALTWRPVCAFFMWLKSSCVQKKKNPAASIWHQEEQKLANAQWCPSKTVRHVLF